MNDSAVVYPWLLDKANLLSLQWQAGRLHHAMLLHGSEGLGKGALAEVIARGLLCFERYDLTHCGRCKSCLLIKAGNHPDLLIFQQGEKALGIDDIRSINQFVEQPPLIAKRRVVVIKALEHMTVEAANGLLKSMEEPNINSYMVLCCHQFDRLLPTIVSRCFKLTVNGVALNELFSWLQDNGIDVSDEVMREKIAQLFRLVDEAPLKLRGLIDGGKLAVFTEIEHKFTLWCQGQIPLLAFKEDVVEDDFALLVLRFLLHQRLKQQLVIHANQDLFYPVEQIITQLTAFSRDGQQIIGQNKSLALIRMLNQLDSSWPKL